MCSTEYDYCDEFGANLIRERIKAYWAARGQAVELELKPAPFTPAIRSVRFDVRSDMRNGWPTPPALPSSQKDAA